MIETISDPEGFFVAVACAVTGWCFGYFFHRRVLGGGSILADWQFGWCVFMPCLLFLTIRFAEAAIFRNHILVDAAWALAWITPLTTASMIGYRAGRTNPKPLGTIPFDFAVTNDDQLYLVAKDPERIR